MERGLKANELSGLYQIGSNQLSGQLETLPKIIVSVKWLKLNISGGSFSFRPPETSGFLILKGPREMSNFSHTTKLWLFSAQFSVALKSWWALFINFEEGLEYEYMLYLNETNRVVQQTNFTNIQQNDLRLILVIEIPTPLLVRHYPWFRWLSCPFHFIQLAHCTRNIQTLNVWYFSHIF